MSALQPLWQVAGPRAAQATLGQGSGDRKAAAAHDGRGRTPGAAASPGREARATDQPAGRAGASARPRARRVLQAELAAARQALDALRAERDALAGELAARDAALRRKDLAAAEMDHRVANSLQMTRDVLALHAAASRDPEAARQLREAAVRVQTIGAVHRRLCRPDAACAGEAAAVDARDHLSCLLRDLLAATGADPGRRPLALAVEPDLALRPEHLVAVGLVATELVINALKHGRGGVRVEVRRAPPDGVEVAVEDDGPGFPEGFDPRRSHGVGMRLVAAYAARHGGLRIGRAAGGGGGARIAATLAA